MNTYICRYCRQPSDPGSPTCPLCGAPVDIRSVVSDSGWVEQPPIRDMARLQLGQSHCQIAGTTVPAAEFTLAPEDWIYFSHHVLLWTEPQTRLTNMPMKGAWNRKMAGLPLIMVEARGPGHLALSDNHAGEIVALPMQHGQQIWVREHRFLVATGNVKYDWYPSDVWYETGQDSDDREMHYPIGRYGDVFGAQAAPGLLLLHAPGNVFIRDLRPGRDHADPAELPAVPGRDGADGAAPGVSAEPGLVLLAQLVELPQHLGQAVGTRPGRGAVGLRAARGHRGHPPPLVRYDPPLVTVSDW